MRTVVFIRKKRAEANSIEEIFHSLLKFLGPNVELLELPYGGASISAIFKNIRFAMKHRGDINHISGEVHYIILGIGRRTLITIHDIQSIIKGGFIARIIKKWLWFKIPILIARKISVISEFTKNELIELFPFVERKICVVNNPINDFQIPPISIFTQTLSLTKTILHLGTKPNKNLEGVLRAIMDIPVRLVVVGLMTEDQKRLADSLNIDYEIFHNLPYVRVLELYAQADIVTFPSFYEGFGMPIIEANLIGVPILVSDISVLREVAEGAAYFVDPNSTNSIRQGIIELMGNTELRDNLIKLGKKNIKRFSPQNIAEQYRNLYNQL